MRLPFRPPPPLTVGALTVSGLGLAVAVALWPGTPGPSSDVALTVPSPSRPPAATTGPGGPGSAPAAGSRSPGPTSAGSAASIPTTAATSPVATTRSASGVTTTAARAATTATGSIAAAKQAAGATTSGSTPGTTAGATTVAARGTVPIGLAATKGTATYYTADGVGGACMPVDRSATGYTVAVGPAEYAEGRACGSYVEVTGARGSVVAKVDDLCPECGRGHLDLSRQAFAAVDDPVKGLVPITYRGLRDPPVAPLVLKVKEGSSRWWLGLYVDNAGNPLAAVEVATDGSSWRALVRQPYGFWTHASDLGGESPLRVRVTDVYGHRVTLDGVRFEVGVLQRTSVRLY